MPKLAEIWIYPLKSGRGLRLEQARITPMGLEHDRRWMLVDPDGRFITQREAPRMALIEVSLENGLEFGFGAQKLQLPCPPYPSDSFEVIVWRSRVRASAVSAAADSWFSQVLERPCRLVYLPPESLRPTNPDYAPGRQVSFADGYPYLLCSLDSLADLNQKLAATGKPAVGIERFRPNLVLAGAQAFAEDGWKQLRIGGQDFEVVKPCERCVIISTDQATGAVGKEPLATLAGYRRLDGKVIFGQNLVCLSETGILSRGDALVPRE